MDFLRICDRMNTKVVELKNKRLFQPTMVIQFLLTIAIFIVGIITVFNNNIINIFYGLLALDLLTLAYNNYKFFKKKYMNYFYILFATYLIISIIINIW